MRAWFEAHHGDARELWVGYHKKGTRRPTITWPESVDEALCVGWIDGVRKSIDDERYTIRFTPRTRGSAWSSVNVAKAQELIREGRMRPDGLAAFEARRAERSGIYSYEQRNEAKLPADFERRFREHERAWAFFEAQPPGYRQTAIWWIVTAKREEARVRRLERLIADSEAGRRTAR